MRQKYKELLYFKFPVLAIDLQKISSKGPKNPDAIWQGTPLAYGHGTGCTPYAGLLRLGKPRPKNGIDQCSVSCAFHTCELRAQDISQCLEDVRLDSHIKEDQIFGFEIMRIRHPLNSHDLTFIDSQPFASLLEDAFSASPVTSMEFSLDPVAGALVPAPVSDPGFA